MSIFGKIGSWFGSTFKHIGEAIVAFIKSDGVKAILQTAEGKVVQAVVAELSLSNLSGAEKRQAAISRIGSELKSAGLAAKDSWISLAIELVVQLLKVLGPSQ